MKYPAAREQTGTGFSAYVIDLDGCDATGATLEEIREDDDAISAPAPSFFPYERVWRSPFEGRLRV